MWTYRSYTEGDPVSTPPYPAIPPPFGTQNLKDDDPEVIDSLIQATSAPADIHEGIVPVIPVPQFKPVPVTRFYATTAVLALGAQAYKILNEDINRLTCRLRITSTAASPTYADYVLIGDNFGSTSFASQNYLLTAHHGGGDVSLDGHTGNVFIIPGPSITGNIEVTAWGVTSYDR